MRTGSFYKKHIGVIASGVLGAAVFLLIFGFLSLDITGCRLFSRGDPGMHYIGWRFYKEAPFQWKMGLMNNLNNPYSVSVIFTDSVPVVAVFFKLFRRIIPETFNYFGLWTLASFVLQGIFSYKLLSLKIRNKLLRSTGVLFFILTPAFIKRAFWHTALTSHFLILASLYLLMYPGNRKNLYHGIKDPEFLKKELLPWTAMGILCASIHLYFLGICGLIAVFTSVDRWHRETENVLYAFLVPVFFNIAGIVTVFFLGGFDSGMSAAAGGFGQYSFNLNSFFNGYGWSPILNFSYYKGGQIEGFAYLGIGMLVILGITCVFKLLRKVTKAAGNPAKESGNPDYSVVPVCFALGLTAFIFALSNVITFSDKVLFHIDLKGAGFIKQICGIFRSSGRFAWITMYLMMLWGFYSLDSVLSSLDGAFNIRDTDLTGPDAGRGKSRCRNRASIVIILLLLFLQIIDLSPGLYARSYDVRETEEYESMLTDKYWGELSEAGKYRHLIFMDKKSLTEEELYSLAFFAVNNNMTVNDFNFARGFDLNTDEIAALSASKPERDSIYIFSNKSYGEAHNFPGLRYYIADGLLVGVAE